MNLPKPKKITESPTDSAPSAKINTLSGSEPRVKNTDPNARTITSTTKNNVALLLSNASPRYQASSGSSKSAKQNQNTTVSKFTALPSASHRIQDSFGEQITQPTYSIAGYSIASRLDLPRADFQQTANAASHEFRCRPRNRIYYVGPTTKSLGNRLFKTNRGQQINSWRNDAVAFALPGNLTRRQVEAFETSVLIAVGGKVSRFTLNSKWPVAEKFWTELGIDK